MTVQNHISVALIGIPEIEEKRLNAAFLHSQSRQISYYLVGLDESPQLLMVNADEPHALIAWRRYRNRFESIGKAEPPSILVSRDRQFDTIHYQVKRPLISSRAISILDQASAKEFSLNQEIAINGTVTETDNEALSPDVADQNADAPRALVIDDSLPVRIQMAQALKQFSVRVDFAESGEEAFEYINANEYQLIFLDVILPGMDGYEVCRAIKKGNAKNTPIIMLTGNSTPADKIKGKLAGCDTYLIKPVGQTIFREVVSEYLSGYESVSSAV